jgi:hypothetical protein
MAAGIAAAPTSAVAQSKPARKNRFAIVLSLIHRPEIATSLCDILSPRQRLSGRDVRDAD